jgi:hypothetical protein
MSYNETSLKEIAMATKTGLTTMDAVVKLMEFNKLYNTIVTATVNEKNALTQAEWALEDAKFEILRTVDVKELGSNSEQREAKLSGMLAEQVKAVRSATLRYELVKAEEQKCRANLEFAKHLVRASEALTEA